jgi:hypothetical protein
MWPMNQTSGDDPLCIYRTGIMPARLACWPVDVPYPSEAVELAELHQEFKDWAFTYAGAMTYSPEELAQISVDAAALSQHAWAHLSGEHRG